MMGKLKYLVSVFKAAKLKEQMKSVLLQPKWIPFESSVIDGLKEELPQYLTLAADTSNEIEPLDWWKRHEVDLSKWSGSACQIVLVQPSSVAAECVFSILHCSFCDQNSLEDYIEASVQLQYNHH